MHVQTHDNPVNALWMNLECSSTKAIYTRCAAGHSIFIGMLTMLRTAVDEIGKTSKMKSRKESEHKSVRRWMKAVSPNSSPLLTVLSPEIDHRVGICLDVTNLGMKINPRFLAANYNNILLQRNL
jgi:hypothetical protein